QDILVAENSLQQQQPIALQATPQAAGGTGGLVLGTDYYYVVTGTSDHTVVGSGIDGETLPSNAVASGPIPQGDTTASVRLTWGQYNSPTTAGYNIYRGVAGTGGSAPATYRLIGHVTGATTTTFTDTGLAPGTQQTTPATASNYGFNPLS